MSVLGRAEEEGGTADTETFRPSRWYGLSMDPLGLAVLEALDRGVAIFDLRGLLVYANPPARRLLDRANGQGQDPRHSLIAHQGRAVPLRDGTTSLGEAVLLTSENGATSLADREREAILEALTATGGRLAEAARRLGISRTTLWRRLRTYSEPPRPGAPS
jgi:PAS domain-containing protein